MLIVRESPLTGRVQSLDLPVTIDQMLEWTSGARVRHIQAIFPQLSPAQREFILTGITPEEQRAYCTEENNE